MAEVDPGCEEDTGHKIMRLVRELIGKSKVRKDV